MRRWNPYAELKTARHVPPEQKQERNRRWKQKHYRWYNLAVWRKGSKQFLQRNPLCEHCKSKGIVKPATDVDHRTPHRGDWSLFIDSGNWSALCHECHARKTTSEMGWHGRAGGE